MMNQNQVEGLLVAGTGLISFGMVKIQEDTLLGLLVVLVGVGVLFLRGYAKQ